MYLKINKEWQWERDILSAAMLTNSQSWAKSKPQAQNSRPGVTRGSEAQVFGSSRTAARSVHLVGVWLRSGLTGIWMIRHFDKDADALFFFFPTVIKSLPKFERRVVIVCKNACVIILHDMSNHSSWPLHFLPVAWILNITYTYYSQKTCGVASTCQDKPNKSIQSKFRILLNLQRVLPSFFNSQWFIIIIILLKRCQLLG